MAETTTTCSTGNGGCAPCAPFNCDIDGNPISDVNVKIPVNDCMTGIKIGEDPDEGKVDVEQVEKLYDMFSNKIREQLQEDYDCGKINGPTFANLWASMMPDIMKTSISAVIELQTKETARDRALKEAQLCEMKQDFIRKNALTDVEISSKELQKDEIVRESARKDRLTETECELKAAQRDEARFKSSELLPAQKGLIRRQICGFDDNIAIKMFEAKWSYNAMVTSSGMVDGVWQDVYPVNSRGCNF